MRRLPTAGVLLLTAVVVASVAVPTLHGQAAQTDQKAPAFEVASVKQNTSVSDVSNTTSAGGRFTITNSPLRFIILQAYHLLDHELVGGPEWIWTTAYDITATYPTTSVASQDTTRAMLQNLLADRFGLTLRRERRTLPMYALVLTNKSRALGPQLVRSNVDCERWTAEKRPAFRPDSPSTIAPGGRRPACSLLASRKFVTAGTVPIQRLAVALQSLVQRPVVDRTGLEGQFDIDLKWANDDGAGLADSELQASIFTALQEQLGLKLEPIKGPVEVLVIDRVERPTPD